MILEGKVLE